MTTSVGTLRAGRRPWRLGGRARKLTLVLHLCSVGAWLGLDVAMAVLVFTALGTDDAGTRALCFRALDLVTIWPMTVAGLGCLVTGVLLAYGGRYGLTRYWWVVVKLVVNLLLTTLVLVALRPQVQDLASVAQEQGTAGPAPTDLVFPPVVSPALLVFAVVLSVFKPWGRLRRRPE